MKLSEKMKRLAQVSQEIEELTAHLLDEKHELEAEIKAEVLELGQSIEVDNVKAKYSKGRGRYDWKATVEEAKPPAGDLQNRLRYNSVVASFTEVVEKVDYTKIAKELELDGKAHYKSGTPSVSIVIKQ